MNIPECVIAGLSLLALGLFVARIRMEILSFTARGKGGGAWKKGKGACETGASKTIGDREIQEDEYGICEGQEGTMAVLADGMGRHYGGKIASRIAVETFLEVFEEGNAFYNPQYSFRRAFQGANRRILNKLEEEQGAASVGVVMVRDHKLYYAIVGNVKVAVYRNGELVPVSSGHTIHVLARQKYEEGKLTKQEAVSLLNEHRLYNYVGQDGFRDIEFFDKPIRLYEGEYVALMTDGLYEIARWKDLEDCLEGEGSCQEKAYSMIELVNRSETEGKDNGAVVLIRC